ncbi:MAG: glycosyltransferase family 4 protein [candidate division WOR-3 bacterium]
MTIKRVLIVTYYWPPLGGPGSLRPVKFAKYLPRFGFKPIILTRKNIAYHSFDHELAEDVPYAEVIRTDSLDPARVLNMLGMRRYVTSTWHAPIKQTINFPDNKTPWIPFAYSVGIKKEVDYILVTAPPFSAFITGYYIAKRTGKPLVVDFRDAWLEFPFMRYRGQLQKRFVRYWEEKVVRNADLITVVDENIRDTLLGRYPRVASRMHVVPNGYDPDDFARVKPLSVFTISYLGTIREERNPQTLLNAIERFIEASKLHARDVRLQFIGHIESTYLAKLKQYSFVEIKGHLPYKKAIADFCAAHVSVLITTGSKYFFPSRQNEYLASGLPIIVCGKSAGLHVLENAFKKGYPGWIFDYNDVEGMSKKIAEIYRKYRRGIAVRGKTPHTDYTREKLTKRLAELIEKI